MSHRCFAAECDKQVADSMLMCGRHWFRVPKKIRDVIWATVRVDRAGYVLAVADAVDAVAKKEGVTIECISAHLDDRFGEINGRARE